MRPIFTVTCFGESNLKNQEISDAEVYLHVVVDAQQRMNRKCFI